MFINFFKGNFGILSDNVELELESSSEEENEEEQNDDDDLKF